MSHKIKKKTYTTLDDSTRFKILFTLIQKNDPMRLTDIAKETKLSEPLVFHHLPKLKEDGLIGELDDKTYICQPFFYDKEIMEDLNSLMRVIVKIILREIKQENPGMIQDELEKSLKNNLEIFIQTFAIEMMD